MKTSDVEDISLSINSTEFVTDLSKVIDIRRPADCIALTTAVIDRGTLGPIDVLILRNENVIMQLLDETMADAGQDVQGQSRAPAPRSWTAVMKDSKHYQDATGAQKVMICNQAIMLLRVLEIHRGLRDIVNHANGLCCSKTAAPGISMDTFTVPTAAMTKPASRGNPTTQPVDKRLDDATEILKRHSNNKRARTEMAFSTHATTGV